MPKTAERRQSPGRAASAPRQRWPWFLPPVLAMLVTFTAPLGLLDYLLGLVLAAPLVVFAARRPDRGLLLLAVFLPLQKVLVAILFRVGVPIPIVRGIGLLKEMVLLGILAAGIHAIRKEGRKLDHLDRLVVVFVAGVTLYLLLPQVLSADGAPNGVSARFQGYRANVFFLLLFLGARHAPLGADLARRFTRVLVGVIVFVAAIGIYQFIDPLGWLWFTEHVAEMPRFLLVVQGETPAQVVQSFGWLREVPVRVGSVLISPFEFVDFALIGLALTLDRVTRGNASARVVVGSVAIAFAIVSSRTRINLIAAAIVLIVILRPRLGRRREAAARLAIVAVVAVIVATPFQIGTRITGAEGGSRSADEHVVEFTSGLRSVLQHPEGLGLGTSPGVAARFGFHQLLISDNAYLQVGQELGIPMMLLFIALLALVLRELQLADRARPSPLAASLFAAGLGLCAAGMLHHVWLSFPVSWLFFGGAGIALSRHDTDDATQARVHLP